MKRKRQSDVSKEREVGTHFSTGQDDFSRHEDEQHNLGLDHTIDKTREELWQDDKRREN